MNHAARLARVAVVKDFGDLTAILVAQAPRQQAGKVVELIVARTRSSAGAVLAPPKEGRGEDDLVLFASTRELSATRIARAFELWRQHRATLEGGAGSITGGDDVLAAIREGDHVVAYLYLDHPQAFDPMAVTTFNMALAKAVQFDANDIGPSIEDLISGPEHGRERLVAMLHRNEGNISRVARLMGVTRRTIYLRMQRYGIPRERVPKSNTPRVPRRSPA